MGFSSTTGDGSQCHPKVVREQHPINPKGKIWKGSRIKDNKGAAQQLSRYKIML